MSKSPYGAYMIPGRHRKRLWEAMGRWVQDNEPTGLVGRTPGFLSQLCLVKRSWSPTADLWISMPTLSPGGFQGPLSLYGSFLYSRHGVRSPAVLSNRCGFLS